jgi:hypothetical protein
MNEQSQDQNNNIFDKYVVKNDDDDMTGIVSNEKIRKYDLSITYDFYHQTPRMWFIGYSADGRMLT